MLKQTRHSLKKFLSCICSYLLHSLSTCSTKEIINFNEDNTKYLKNPIFVLNSLLYTIVCYFLQPSSSPLSLTPFIPSLHYFPSSWPSSPHLPVVLPELAKCRYSVEAAHTGILTPTCAHTAHGDATAPRPHSIQEDNAWHLPLPQITPELSPRPS